MYGIVPCLVNVLEVTSQCYIPVHCTIIIIYTGLVCNVSLLEHIEGGGDPLETMYTCRTDVCFCCSIWIYLYVLWVECYSGICNCIGGGKKFSFGRGVVQP